LIYIRFIAMRKNEASGFIISGAGPAAGSGIFSAMQRLGASPEFCTNSVDKSVCNTPAHDLSH
jgi:hypothetical protein